MSDGKGKERTRQYRDQRRASGFRETSVWLPQEVRERLDAEVQAGRFKTLSDAIGAAIGTYFKEPARPMT